MLLRDPFADEFLVAYLQAADRYTDSVTEMSRLANGLDRAAFLLSYERARTLVVEAEEARSALIKHGIKAA